ncbi:cbb3-type cytochrome oxidase assembly protein CcoS [Dichotomicrobium thermohalophilum]|uniref:Cbb3-type cytochrome oxidase maturation protein n=1 Tax=Dichotomicrobium thermohalophilum TaxID=933063 RepID=A0A397PP41_9HYPH|nr:cbb3-type cytochrome oxidase assembly protein CcoS [Dichotomicrobium thermohalophilum]RIA47804.1 cbb3-type cytochrome oxidase maturation protein [Dichotomicrobium thermohalophilum]
MTALAWLIPAALFLGFLGVLAFMWALRSGQFEDLDGAAYRILEDDTPETRDKDATPANQPPSDTDKRQRDHDG